MEAKQKEIQIFNIPIDKYLEMTGKSFSCYDAFDVSVLVCGCSQNYDFDSKKQEAFNNAEEKIREKAKENGAFVVVNTEYSHDLECDTHYTKFSFRIKGVALKDKEG